MRYYCRHTRGGWEICQRNADDPTFLTPVEALEAAEKKAGADWLYIRSANHRGGIGTAHIDGCMRIFLPPPAAPERPGQASPQNTNTRRNNMRQTRHTKAWRDGYQHGIIVAVTLMLAGGILTLAVNWLWRWL